MSHDDFWRDTARTAVFEHVDAARFVDEIQPLHRPAILKGLVRNWPMFRAAQDSPQALKAYMLRMSSGVPIEANFGPPSIKGLFGYAPDMRGYNFEKRTLPLGDFFDLLMQHKDTAAPPALQGSSLNIVKYMSPLIEEAPIDLIDPGYERLVSVWIGNQVRTAAHWDLPQNIACVVSGRRRYTLMPMEQVKNLYIGPLDFTLAGRPTSLVDFHNPDFEAFPNFRDAMAHAEIADLEPGDALYLPSVWIHHVETLDPIGAMVNFWWREAPEHMLSPYMTMLHALLTLRDLPEHERAPWRALFDLYVFEREGDPMGHVPLEARGLWGPMTPEKVARLKAYLIKTLSS